MKNNDNTALLAHQRRIDEQRKAAAIARKRRAHLATLRAMGGAK